MTARAPVVMIGLDAAEVALIDRLGSEGRLPALQALRERGCFGLLESNARLFGGAVWPSFYASKDVPWTGLYHNKTWRPEHMRVEMVSETWLAERPFWHRLGGDGRRLALLDVPTVLTPGRPLNGIQLTGWGAHDLFYRGSWPRGLWRDLRRRFGSPSMTREVFGPQSAATLLDLRERLLRATEQLGAIARASLTSEAWDLFLVVFGAPHRGGHYLWDLSQIDRSGLPERQLRRLEHALEDVYCACDAALAGLLESVAPDARVLVFALHGMGPNDGWSERCPEMLARIQQVEDGAPPSTGLLFEMKRRLPWRLARQVTTRLPERLAGRLVALWSARMFEWRKTRFFPVPMDLAGYVRINLRGRERDGVVEPGPEYRRLIQDLSSGLSSFRDAETGEPIVDRVHTLDELAPPGAPYRDVLPDLVVTWNDVPATRCRAIVSERHGELRWDPGTSLPSGRAGNHRDTGWFVAAGPGIRPGSRADGHSILDLVPTALRWLGAEPPADFQGQPIPALLGPAAGGPRHPLDPAPAASSRP